MPAQTETTGFRFIDTYNHIRQDVQAGRDYEEEDLESLDQQGVPQFTFASTPPSPPTTTTVQQKTVNHHHEQPRVYTPTLSSSPSPSPTTPSLPAQSYTPPPLAAAVPPPSPCCPPSAESLPSQHVTSDQEALVERCSEQEQAFHTLLDMEVSASFLEELMGQPTAPASTTLLTPLQPCLPVPFIPVTTTTSFVTEVAAAGCTLVQTTDQQLLPDMDLVELCDLDKQGGSFYDDLPTDASLKETLPSTFNPVTAMDWIGDFDLPQTGSGSGSCLTELGVMGSPEQEDLLSAFESLRRDIVQDCRQLNISHNPRAWSGQDSQSWVIYMLDKFQRADDCSTSLLLPGPALCQKTEAQLLWLSPSNGTFLRQQLDLWLAVAELPPALQSRPQQQSVTTSPQSGATVPCLAPSVSPAPSTDSLCSSDQSSLSSSSSSSSDAEIHWGLDSSEAEDWVHESIANSRTTQPRPSSSSSSTSTTSTTRSIPRGRQGGSRGAGKQIRLWEFLRELLEDADPSIKWLDRQRGVFKIDDSNRVARLWGQRKNHPAMNYDKLSRSVRQYYKKGIIKKTSQTRRLVYQFCERYL